MASLLSSQPFSFGQPTGTTVGISTPSLSQQCIGNQQFAVRYTGNSSQLPNHSVTTTSGTNNFPIGLNGSIPQQQSPNRSVNSLSRMPGFGLSHTSRSFLNHNLLNGIPSSSYGAPQSLDLSEFPLLSSKYSSDNSSSSIVPNLMQSRPPYVGMVKQVTNGSGEFHIHNEDFPALPGSQNHDYSQDEVGRSSVPNELSKGSGHFHTESNSESEPQGIQTLGDGRITNIPPGMVTDQFGMVGLLTFIRAADTDSNLVSLALGSDLTTLGLNLNTPDNLYPNFGGPWSDHPRKPQDTDCVVPSEYIVNHTIRDRLADVKLNRYGEDLLFFLFYMFSGEILQLSAAIELYNRNWRFHKDERVWITRVPGMVPSEKSSSFERGMYYFFEPVNWRKIAKEFHLDYDRLEERPHLPSSCFHPVQSV